MAAMLQLESLIFLTLNQLDCLKKSWTFDNVSKELKGLNVRYINPKHQVMDQRAFQFATIGHYIKGK